MHLRFDIPVYSLPDEIKARLLALNETLITQEGVQVLKAQQYRTQEMNCADALACLQEVVDSVAVPPKARRADRGRVHGGRGRAQQGFGQHL